MASNEGLVKSYLADAAIASYSIVSVGSDDNHVVGSTAGTDSHVGVSDKIGASEQDSTVDVVVGGIAYVLYGSAVSKGAFVSANADGRAVPAVSGDRVVGRAEKTGVNGDIGLVLLAPFDIA